MFGTLTADILYSSFTLASLASNICFSHSNVFQNGVNFVKNGSPFFVKKTQNFV